MPVFTNFNFPTRRCSAALAYCFDNGELYVTLVSNKKRTEFLFPKGGIEPGLSPASNAQKEFREESGYDCDADGFSLGSYQFVKRGIVNHVEVFALHMSSGQAAPKGTDVENRQVITVDIDRALEEVSPYLQPFLIALAQHLSAQQSHDLRKKK